jgi:ABC-type polar amino acid transport system ATPase subunit
MEARVTVPVLAVEGLCISRGDRTIVEGASLAVHRGEIVAMMGPSGSGKTTILRAVARLERFDRGSIAIDGRVGMVFQFHHLFTHMSALDNVCLAPVHVHGVPRARAQADALELFAMLGIGHVAGAMPHELSGGEAQRVAIARALAVNPPLVLMDEPTASLDAERRGDLANTLRDLAARGRALVVATHDEDFARACATRVMRLMSGRLNVEGDEVS